MTFRYTVAAVALGCAAALLCGIAAPRAVSAAARKAKKHLLVVTVTKGFRHGSIPVAEKTIEMLGESTGNWDTDYVRTDDEMASKMTAEGLKKYDAVVFANTTGVLPLPDPQAFLNFVKSGHGFAAMHSGSDTFHEWPGSKEPVSAYAEMLGGEFLTHHAQCAIMGHMADTKSPALRNVATMTMQGGGSLESRDVQREGSATDGKTWRVFDEIYLLKNNDPAKVHTLIWLDKYPNDSSPDANKPGIHLISWTKSYGTGRVFYTELGHRDEVWKDPIYQKHVTGGIEFALGISRGSTTPGNVTEAMAMAHAAGEHH